TGRRYLFFFLAAGLDLPFSALAGATRSLAAAGFEAGRAPPFFAGAAGANFFAGTLALEAEGGAFPGDFAGTLAAPALACAIALFSAGLPPAGFPPAESDLEAAGAGSLSATCLRIPSAKSASLKDSPPSSRRYQGRSNASAAWECGAMPAARNTPKGRRWRSSAAAA